MSRGQAGTGSCEDFGGGSFRSGRLRVAAHGGHVDLVGVDDGKAMISFGGGCQGCGMVDVTLKEGIEVMITEGVPEITEIVDLTDHDAGTNPFY